MARTKLVCTIGPATSARGMIARLVEAGMSLARLNFSYGTHAQHSRTIRAIRGVAEKANRPVAILMDLPGSKLRTGRLVRPEVRLEEGAVFSLVSEDVRGDESRVSARSPAFFRDIRPGNTIFLNDGAIQLSVTDADRAEIRCRVVVGGVLTENRGINIPGVRLSIPSLGDRDLDHLAFGIERGVDFVGVSFVRSAADIEALKDFVRQKGSRVPLIAKIEKHEAVSEVDGIIAAADGIMVARGDLGVEISLERVPVVQKEIIRKCNQAGKPVIVATQMLESMIGASRPTRAEVSDVANAIFDSADAVMLSGETAIGRYPLEALQTMARIAAEAERALPYERLLLEKSDQVSGQSDDAISYAACHTAQRLGAAAIVAYTASGSTGLRLSRYRPSMPILAITPYAEVARRLALSWGVMPLLASEQPSVEAVLAEAVGIALRTGTARKGQLIVVVAGIPLGVPGSTNLIKVHRIE